MYICHCYGCLVPVDMCSYTTGVDDCYLWEHVTVCADFYLCTHFTTVDDWYLCTHFTTVDDRGLCTHVIVAEVWYKTKAIWITDPQVCKKRKHITAQPITPFEVCITKKYQLPYS